ncbi:predicted protein [Coccidioides posadasii str. Silveira]|uniref:Predicted protein n=2 Tax=Coccidioides posadasii TaxID=199306 RepID=E9D3C0_COCPS|nr:predicted protein [Coccidioides posadasii str. Silveira]KMM71464.1 hypothetical protein CPAG_07771 [Coccidioides posadasii RMSCC 3488]
MSSTEAEPRSTIAINDDTDAETDAPRSPPRELRRTSRLMDNSLPEYEALFDGRAILNSSASTRVQTIVGSVFDGIRGINNRPTRLGLQLPISNVIRDTG